MQQTQVHIDKMQESIKSFIKFQNDALFYGDQVQSEEWIYQILQVGTLLYKNKEIAHILRLHSHEDLMLRFEQFLCLINPSNVDLVRRLSWKLAKMYFKQSVLDHEKKDYKLALQKINKAKQFFENFLDQDSKVAQMAFLKQQKPFKKKERV